MGLFDKLGTLLNASKNECNLLVVGLDNSGKTSIINYFKPPEAKSHVIVPTIGFNVEKFNLKAINFTAFDMSGQGRYRNLWEHYYKEADAIIFVIDTSDRIRWVVAKEELSILLEHADIKNRQVPILFYANKSDMKGGLSISELTKELDLDEMKSKYSDTKRFNVFESNALTGNGLNEGVDWLVQQLKSEWK